MMEELKAKAKNYKSQINAQKTAHCEEIERLKKYYDESLMMKDNEISELRRSQMESKLTEKYTEIG